MLVIDFKSLSAQGYPIRIERSYAGILLQLTLFSKGHTSHACICIYRLFCEGVIFDPADPILYALSPGTTSHCHCKSRHCVPKHVAKVSVVASRLCLSGILGILVLNQPFRTWTGQFSKYNHGAQAMSICLPCA